MTTKVEQLAPCDISAILSRLIQEDDRGLIENRARLRALLSDLCPGGSRDVTLVLAAQEFGVPTRLAAVRSASEFQSVDARLRNQLESRGGLAPLAAERAVALWAYALSVPGSDRFVAPPGVDDPGPQSDPSHSESAAGRRRERPVKTALIWLTVSGLIVLAIGLWLLERMQSESPSMATTAESIADQATNTPAAPTVAVQIAVTPMPSPAPLNPARLLGGGCWEVEQLASPRHGADSVQIAQWTSAPSLVLSAGEHVDLEFTTTHGRLVVRLATSEDLVAANNFFCLARAGFFDSTLFYQVSKDTILGGDPTASDAGGPGYQFSATPSPTLYTRGTLAFSVNGEGQAGSRFILFLEDYPSPSLYPLVGRVVDGEATLDALSSGTVNSPGIISVTIVQNP